MVPARVRPVRTPAAVRVGTIALSPVAAGSAVTVKVSTLANHDCALNDDALRASSQVSICRAETTGTPCALAEATVAEASVEAATSVCALMV